MFVVRSISQNSYLAGAIDFMKSPYYVKDINDAQKFNSVDEALEWCDSDDEVIPN